MGSPGKVIREVTEGEKKASIRIIPNVIKITGRRYSKSVF